MNMRSHDDRDRTAKAVIRDEALRLFAERGADAVTVREIAAASGVSPALVMQHYGSKDGLRDAVDDHVLDEFAAALEAVTAGFEDAAGSGSSGLAALLAGPGGPLTEGAVLSDYLGRLLVTPGDAGDRLFRKLFEVARGGLDRLVGAGQASPGQNPEIRAAFLLANDLGLILLRRRLAMVLGLDPLTPAGLAAWGAEVLAVYGSGLKATVTEQEGGTHDV